MTFEALAGLVWSARTRALGMGPAWRRVAPVWRSLLASTLLISRDFIKEE